MADEISVNNTVCGLPLLQVILFVLAFIFYALSWNETNDGKRKTFWLLALVFFILASMMFIESYILEQWERLQDWWASRG